MALKMYFSGKVVTEDIKPCPFCGSDNLAISDRKNYLALVKEHGSSMLIIECRECDTEVQLYDIPNNSYAKGSKKIIEKWNTRKEREDGVEKDQ